MNNATNMKISKNDIIKEAAENVYSRLGDSVVKCVLFGSYARGEQKEFSDIDMAVFFKTSRKDLSKYYDILTDITTDIAMKYMEHVSFLCVPVEEYVRMKDNYSLYRNIENEGVLYDR